jgi:hypothetical protein
VHHDALDPHHLRPLPRLRCRARTAAYAASAHTDDRRREPGPTIGGQKGMNTGTGGGTATAA